MSFLESVYKYEAIEICTSAFKYWTPIVLKDGPLRRKVLLEKVKELHLRNNGVDNNLNCAPMLKKALADLQLNGVVENVCYGTWRLTDANSTAKSSINIDFEEEEDLNNDPKPTSSFVYVYYFPSYREVAESLGKKCWPCKIGRTSLSASLRISQQTGIPEVPSKPLVFETPDSTNLEKALHSILTLRGKHIVDAPGREWFLTCYDEVEEIVANILKRNSSHDVL